MTRLTPTPEQKQAIDRMAAEPTRAALLAAETGVGKTLMSVELARAIGAKTVLLIAPLNTKDGWLKAVTNQGLDLPFKVINSSAKGVANFEALRAGEPGVYFIGREFFGLSGTEKKATKKSKGRKRRWKWSWVKPDLAIFDEVQIASDRYSTTYTALKTLSAGYKLAASATPNGNRFTGMWSITRWLWKDTHNPDIPYDAEMPFKSMYVDNSFWRWAAQWAVIEYDPFSEGHQKVTREREPGAFVSSLPCYIRIEADRTPVETRKVYVDLTPIQRRIYNEMEADALAWLDEHPLVADFPIVKRVRLRQITLAEPTVRFTGGYDEDGKPEVEVYFEDDAASAKFDALHKIIHKHHPDEPILILTDSQKFARLVTKRLGEGAAEWSGQTKHAERDRIKAEFGKSVKWIVAVIPAIAEGVDGLQTVCSTEVWLSESTNDMLNQQVEGRINRQGQKAEKITRYKVMARGTDDDGTFQRLIETRTQNRRSLRRTA